MNPTSSSIVVDGALRSISTQGIPEAAEQFLGDIDKASDTISGITNFVVTQPELLLKGRSITDFIDETKNTTQGIILPRYPVLSSQICFQSLNLFHAAIMHRLINGAIEDQVSSLSHISFDTTNHGYKVAGKVGRKTSTRTICFGKKRSQATALKEALSARDTLLERRESKPNTRICRQLLKQGILSQTEDGRCKIVGLRGTYSSKHNTQQLNISRGNWNRRRSRDFHGFSKAYEELIEELCHHEKLSPQQKRELLKLGDMTLYKF